MMSACQTKLFQLTVAKPCFADGTFLSKEEAIHPQPHLPIGGEDSNKYAPFEDRLAFDWAHHHYVELQSAKKKIGIGLDLWLVSVKSSQGLDGTISWESAQDMFAAIDKINEGVVPWTTYMFRYTGPQPETPPAWMTRIYEFNVQDILAVLETLLASEEFDGHFDYIPYEEYNPDGNRIYSNLMSGQWAFTEAVCDSKQACFQNLLTLNHRANCRG
jgi:hypothetical protein